MNQHSACDLIGKRIGKLLVVSFEGCRNKKSYWKCLCDCGGIKIIRRSDLVSGNTTSCGCKLKYRVHGQAYSATYRSWKAMRYRCSNPKNRCYKDYGGRGIAVCERWDNSFENFYADMGERPDGMTIDRIDNNMGYCPKNCRWATAKEQSRNKQNSKIITALGESLCLADWSKKTGLTKGSINLRLAKGIPPDVIFSTGRATLNAETQHG